jgi:regulator of chromosome condensation
MAQVDVGTKQNLAVSTTGVVYSWGFGSHCELGAGETITSRRTPRRVISDAMDGWTIEMASAGGQHCVLLGRQTVESPFE